MVWCAMFMKTLPVLNIHKIVSAESNNLFILSITNEQSWEKRLTSMWGSFVYTVLVELVINWWTALPNRIAGTKTIGITSLFSYIFQLEAVKYAFLSIHSFVYLCETNMQNTGRLSDLHA